ncbi:hypothetical protein ACEQ8H_006046 [Pleosporales sp. CAS-2024a]
MADDKEQNSGSESEIQGRSTWAHEKALNKKKQDKREAGLQSARSRSSSRRARRQRLEKELRDGKYMHTTSLEVLEEADANGDLQKMGMFDRIGPDSTSMNGPVTYARAMRGEIPMRGTNPNEPFIQEKPQGSGSDLKDQDGLKLTLEANLEIEIELKASIRVQPDQAPTERRKPPRKSRLWQRFKHVWHKATRSGDEKQLPLSQVSQDGHASATCENIPYLPLHAVAQEGEAGRINLKPERSQASPFPAPLEPCSASVVSRRSSHSGFLVRIPSFPVISLDAILEKSLAIEERTEPIAVPEMSQTPSLVELKSPIKGEVLSTSSTKVTLKQEDLGIFSPLDLTDYNRHNEEAPFSHGNLTAERQTEPTASERADYDRLIKVVFRPQPTRIPIPKAWRSSTPRAYLYRSPSSPLCNVATMPLPSSQKPAMGWKKASATEPWRSAPGSRAGQHSQKAAAATLRDIAARPVIHFPVTTQDQKTAAAAESLLILQV